MWKSSKTGPRCGDYTATGQLTLRQMLRRYPLLGSVMITNGDWR